MRDSIWNVNDLKCQGIEVYFNMVKHGSIISHIYICMRDILYLSYVCISYVQRLSPWADMRPLLRWLHRLPVVCCSSVQIDRVIKTRLVVVWKERMTTLIFKHCQGGHVLTLTFEKRDWKHLVEKKWKTKLLAKPQQAFTLLFSYVSEERIRSLWMKPGLHLSPVYIFMLS